MVLTKKISPSKPIYRAISLANIVSSFFWRIVIVCLAVYFGFHYNENPVLIGILIGFCFLLFLLIGEDQVDLYPDRLTIQTNSILSWFIRKSGRTFYLNEIKSASLPVFHTEGPDAWDLVFIALLLVIIPRRGSRTRKENVFIIELKNSEIKELPTGISKKQAARIVKEINALVNAEASK